MKAKVWKKNAVLATVILFVCVAVYLNWHYGQETAEDVSGSGVTDVAPDDTERVAAVPQKLTPDGTVTATETPSVSPEGEEQNSQTAAEDESGYFATARLNREQARDESVELLQQTAASEDASQEVRDAAYTEMSKIADNTITESQIEGLVMAKGFQDCVAYISESGVSVIVSSTETGLDSNQVTQIKDIVISETGVSAAAIKILEAEG